jgi:hypothetical protein
MRYRPFSGILEKPSAPHPAGNLSPPVRTGPLSAGFQSNPLFNILIYNIIYLCTLAIFSFFGFIYINLQQFQDVEDISSGLRFCNGL